MFLYRVLFNAKQPFYLLALSVFGASFYLCGATLLLATLSTLPHITLSPGFYLGAQLIGALSFALAVLFSFLEIRAAISRHDEPRRFRWDYKVVAFWIVLSLISGLGLPIGIIWMGHEEFIQERVFQRNKE